MHRSTNTHLEEWASLIGDELPDDIEHVVSGHHEQARASETLRSGRDQ